MKTIKNLKAEEIRKSILQLAIQGKLVKQDPNDEPASELVKKIYAEKQKLIKEGKIKKDKNESFIFKGDDNCYYEKIGNSEAVKLEDLPFDIPDNWQWIRMCNFISLISGTSYDKNDVTNSGLRIIRGGNIQSFNLILEDSDVFLPLSYINKNSIIQKNDILIVASTGSKEVIGKPAFVDKNYENTTIGAFLRIIRPYFQDSFDYLKIIFKSEYYRNIVRHSVRGTNINNLKADTILDMYVPLPPLNEQQRIVDKINSFEPLIKQYEDAESKLSRLEAEFPEKLKKSILQYAIEGKLVKQDPNDEPASILLERIKTEKERLIKEGKIKRDKNESYIYQGDDKNYYEKIDDKLTLCDEIIGFSIPFNWSYSYIENISSYGFTNLNCSISEGEWLLELEDIESCSSKLISRKVVNKNTNLNSKVNFDKGMILYSKLRPYLDKVLIANEKGIATSEIVPFWSFINPLFLIIFLKSPQFLNRVTNLMYGVKMPRLGTDDMIKTIIAIPPINEQQRIIDKLRLFNPLIEINL